MLIDTHAHLNDNRYSTEKVEEIVSSLFLNNIEKVITIGYDTESSFKSVELSEKYDNVYAVVGIHPSNPEEDTNFLEDLSKHKKVVAIGEIGLDYHYPNFNKELQIQTFIKQIKLAYKLKKPIVIHLRDAYEDMLNILKEYKDYLKYGAVVHCYSGSLEYAKELLKLGLYFSFTGVITFKNAKKSLEVIEFLPLDRIMIETDCPYLSPEPYRNVINEPKFVNLVFNKICEIKKLKKETLTKILRENTRNFYKI